MIKLKSVKFIIPGLIILALLVGIITIPILAKPPVSDETNAALTVKNGRFKTDMAPVSYGVFKM